MQSITTTCPATVCTCKGTGTVTATRGVDSETGRATMSYSACAALQAQGWGDLPAVVEWLDEAPADDVVSTLSPADTFTYRGARYALEDYSVNAYAATSVSAKGGRDTVEVFVRGQSGKRRGLKLTATDRLRLVA